VTAQSLVTPSVATALPTPGGVRLGSPAGRWILTAAVLGSAIAGVDSSVMNVALPFIGRDLRASFSQLQWAITGYTLSVAALILLAGALGDHYGRRRIFLTGVCGFTVASLLCAIAPDIGSLIGARSIQGIGGALMIPAGLAIMQSSFVEEDRPQAIGIWAGFGGVSSVVAPFLGGWLLELGTWRWIFVINLPLAVVLIGLSLRHVPESREAVPAPIDWRGSGLALIALAALTYALTTLPKSSASATAPLGSVVVAVGATSAFIWFERRTKAPMIPALVFKSVPFVAASVVSFFVYGAFGAFSFIFTVALEIISGFSPIEAGSTLLPITIIALTLSGPSGKLSARIGPRLQLTVGPLLCGAATLLALQISAHTGYWTAVIPLECVFGLGIATMVAPLTTTALSSVPADHAGVASGINSAIGRTAALLWIAAVPSIVGLSGSSYTNVAALRDGYRLICIICSISLGFGGVLAGVTLRHRNRHDCVDIVPPRLPHPLACG
jgi:EmrB/QacA subfamily drug resistance transporter